MSVPVILVDNRDSFTFNLVDSLRRLGCEVSTYRNNVPAHRLSEQAAAEQALLVLSPGPGRPTESGCCLGLQAIGEQAGVPVERAAQPVHGEASALAHDGAGPFVGLPQPLRVGRYHSLGVRSLPSRLTVHAQLDGMVMAASDLDAGQVGLQFHPESILTPHGDQILINVLEMTERFYDARSA